MINIAQYLTRRYDCPHPCMALVSDVLAENYCISGIPILGKDIGMRQRAEIALDVLSRRCAEVPRNVAREGDIALISVSGLPAHVGVMINGKELLHIPDDRAGVVVESLDSIWLRNRVVGIYRIKT